MGTFPLVHYDMSFHTQNRLQGSRNLLTEAEQKGALLKAHFAGRIALMATGAVLHAEFLARCVLMIGLALVNSVVEFKKEQISIQGNQAYTALCMSAMCFYVLLQPHMLKSMAGWMDQMASSQSKVAIEEIPDGRERIVLQEKPLPISLKSAEGTILSNLFPSEKAELDRVSQIKKKGRQFDQFLSRQDAVSMMENARKVALCEMEKEFAGLELSLKYSSLSERSIEFSNMSYDRFLGLHIVESVSGEIQTLVNEIAIPLKGKEVKFCILGLFEPITGPRASLYLKEHIRQELIDQFKQFAQKETLDDADVFSACQKAYASLQEKFIAFGLNRRIDSVLPSIAEDLSSMTVALIGEDFGYVLNAGHSKALLNNSQDCIPLSLPADPELEENMKMIEARGGNVHRGLVNHALNTATAFGGASTNGVVGALLSVVKFSRKEASPEGSLFLGSSEIFSKLGQRDVFDFYKENSIGAKDRADALTGSLIHSDSKISNIGCLILTFDHHERVSTPASRPDSRLSGLSLDPFLEIDGEPLSAKSDRIQSPYAFKENTTSTPKIEPSSWRQLLNSPISETSSTSSFVELDDMVQELLETASNTSKDFEKVEKFEERVNSEEEPQQSSNAWGFSTLFSVIGGQSAMKTGTPSDTESFEEIDVRALESDGLSDSEEKKSDLDISFPSPLSSSIFG